MSRRRYASVSLRIALRGRAFYCQVLNERNKYLAERRQKEEMSYAFSCSRARDTFVRQARKQLDLATLAAQQKSFAVVARNCSKPLLRLRAQLCL